MKQCPNCGVELEENANFCSLCGEPLLNEDSENMVYIRSGRIHREEKLFTDYQRLNGFQKRKIFWSISGLILISGLIITVLIDFIGNHNITWSKYPASVSLVLFINFTLNTFQRKNPMLMLLLSFLSVTALFVLFDIFAGDTIWEIRLGIPLILAFYGTSVLLVYCIRHSKQKGLNVIAYSMLASGLLCVYTEGMISVFAFNTIHLQWSLVVLVSVALIAPLLLYIHYRLKRATDLKRFFHI
jgi:hypothetical protein